MYQDFSVLLNLCCELFLNCCEQNELTHLFDKLSPVFPCLTFKFHKLTLLYQVLHMLIFIIKVKSDIQKLGILSG